jgi:hypothetical protein
MSGDLPAPDAECVCMLSSLEDTGKLMVAVY